MAQWSEVKFKGDLYLMLRDECDIGCIMTERQFREGLVPHAVIKGNEIIRLGDVIGTVDDIKILRNMPGPPGFTIVSVDW